jgi:biofilm PGA synthesis N-glycosyltransferase PgaC
MSVWEAIATFCFGYPFAMAWYWMAGGLLFALVRRGSEPPPWEPPALSDSP